MTTVFLSVIIVGMAFAMIAIRILLVKGGEFRGSCASNNPYLKAQLGSDCPVCGAKPEETCKNEE